VDQEKHEVALVGDCRWGVEGRCFFCFLVEKRRFFWGAMSKVAFKDYHKKLAIGTWGDLELVNLQDCQPHHEVSKTIP